MHKKSSEELFYLLFKGIEIISIDYLKKREL